MNATAEAPAIAFPELALNADGEVLILDRAKAMEQFVYESLTWELDLLDSEIPELYDEDLILSNVASYDSINGREGFRLRQDLTEERYWQLVEAAKL